MTSNAERMAEGERHRRLDDILKRIQNQLFDLGSELATPPDAAYEGMFRMGEAEVTELERLMDDCQKELAPLKSFILPGGGRIQGFLHQARTGHARAHAANAGPARRRPARRGPATTSQPATGRCGRGARYRSDRR